MAPCPNCGSEARTGAQFCDVCGRPLGTPVSERRSLATMLFCDVTGSTALGERVDAESVRDLMFRYFHEMRDVIDRHGGTVEKFVGDAVMAVFGVPTVHEDDALRAVRAAFEMREQLASLNEELEHRFGRRIELRIGLETGEVVAGDASGRQTFVTGDAVNIAARLEQAAEPNEILLGAPTYHLVRDAVTVEPVEALTLKGKAEPVKAYRLLAMAEREPARPRRHDGPLVGRRNELRLLEDALRAVRSERRCRLVTMVGQPGIGKSRLAREFVAKVARGWTCLRGRCLSYGEGITFWALREIVHEVAGIRDEDSVERAQGRIAQVLDGEPDGASVAEGVAQAIGLTAGTAGADASGWAIRRLLESLARREPVIVLIDDIQWGEPALLDLLARLPRAVSEARLLVLCLARPELLEQRPEWEGTIRLEPLGEAQAEGVIENLLASTKLAPEVRRRIKHAAQGNPLFIEELVAMMIEDALLGTAPAGGAELVIPPTITALLSARLDRIPSGQRAVAERAAIEGEVFHRGAVIELSPPEDRSEVAASLRTLVDGELIRPSQAAFEGEAAFRFRHLLVRDTIYQASPKKLRSELHARFAAWLERTAGQRATEYEEIIGYHLERAYGYRRELGPLDDEGSRLRAHAAERLSRAGLRAFARVDMGAAVNLLSRAIALLDDVGERLELSLKLIDALVEAGEFERAEALIDDTAMGAREAGDERIELRAEIERAALRGFIVPELPRAAEIVDLVDRALPALERAGDEEGLARAWHLRGEVDLFASRYADHAEKLTRALAHARRAGDRREEAELLTSLAVSHYWGSTPADEGIRRCEEILAGADGQPSLRAGVLVPLAAFHAMQGRFDEARAHYETAKTIYTELGLTLWAAGSAIRGGGSIEVLAGDLAAAERELRSALDTLEALGEKGILSGVAGMLAPVVHAGGRTREAERLSRIAERATAAEDVMSGILWRGARARSLAASGALAEAERRAREGVALAETTDALNFHGDVLMVQAEVLRTAGRDSEARAAAVEAASLFNRKGNVVSAAAARNFVATFAPEPSAARLPAPKAS